MNCCKSFSVQSTGHYFVLIRLVLGITLVHLLTLLAYNALHQINNDSNRQVSLFLTKQQVTLFDSSKDQLKNKLVPRLVHYTWYSWHRNTFRFHHLISLLSAVKFIQPHQVIFWCSREPEGQWWRVARQRVSQLVVKHRNPPDNIFGRPLRVPEHQSDVIRLEAVLNEGGIYLDLDVIIVRSFDSLLKYDVSMGYQLDGNGLCNGVIVARPNATFLRIWYQEYVYFLDRRWDYHSVVLPGMLARLWPQLLHVEQTAFHRPNFNERDWIYKQGQLFNWRHYKNYALHLWYRFYDHDHTPEDIRSLNSTLGAIFRLIWYDSDRLLLP